MLFNEYPDNFFAVLHCRYQSLYSDILLRIYGMFYGHEAISQPLREDVRGLIANALEQRGITGWDEELKGDDVERTRLELDDTQYRAHLIYRRLIECGWLEEERDNEFRDVVSMPFYAASLMNVLKDAFLGRKVSYAGYVGNVYLQLRHLENNPHESSFLKEARRNAEELLQKLQELYNSIKTYIKQTKDKEGVAQVLRHFFGNYMENFFSSAYGKVKTVDNPFKYRHNINEILLNLRHNREILLKIAAGYRPLSSNAQLADITEGALLAEVLDDIEAVSSVFSRLDDQMAMIDMKKEQYENIVKEQVRYYEMGHGGLKASIADILKAVSVSPEAAVILSPNLKEFRFVDTSSLSAPRDARKAVAPQKVSGDELDGKDYEVERLKSLIRSTSAVGRKDVAGFIERMLNERPDILGSEMPVNDLKDLTCMLLSKYAAIDAAALDLEDLGRQAENDYLVFEEYRIKKRYL